MNKLYCLIILGLFLSIGKVSAQTSISSLESFDTTSVYCSPPVKRIMTIYGSANGYSSNDSIDFYVNFGDGTDTLFSKPIPNGFIWEGVYHTYQTAGTFSTQYIVTGPDGQADTLNKLNDITVRDSCITSIEITYANNNINVCNVNSPITFNIQGYANDYPSDSVRIDINFGNGDSTILYSPVYGNGFYYYYTYTYDSPGTYTIRYIVTGSDGKADTINGTALISNTCADIKGNVYLDNNANCIMESGEEALSGVAINLKSGSTIIASTYTDFNGNYFFNGLNGTNYTIELSNPNSFDYTPSCPASGSVSFTASGTHINNFAVSCSNSGYDLQGYLFGSGFRPGFNGNIYMNVFNPACTPTSGIATLTLDPLLSFTGNLWGVPATSSTGNVLTWNFSNVDNDFSWYNGLFSGIGVTTSTAAQLGDSVCITLSISPTTGDYDPSNNIITKCYEVRNSWDPNMKEVAPKGIGASGDVAPNPDFTYTVHFQNTGNDVAYNIHIMDTIDSNLDMNTLRIISSSHTMNPYLLNGNIVKFDFPNIMLADSNTNEPMSHGVVVYKIKANQGLPIGTQFKNTAHIFFDINPAVVTNTTLNTIVDPLMMKENSDNDIMLFPNPTSGVMNLNFDKQFSGKIIITDVLGKIIYNETISAIKCSIDMNKYGAGVYSVTARNGDTSIQKKIVVFKK